MDQIIKSENELVELEGVKITRGQIDLIKRTIFIGASDDEMRLFFYECRRRGVHPMDRLIFPVARKDKDGNRHVTFQMGIDYLRAAAEETGRFVGQKPVQYGPSMKVEVQDKDDEGKIYTHTIEVPEWAESTVLRKDSETGDIAEICHRVFWKEYYPGQRLGHMWRKMPFGQLAKCAEAGAHRKAFPRKLGGLYINEEMEQAEAVPFTPIQEPKRKQNGNSEGESPKDILKVTTPILSINEKKGEKGGKPWIQYLIIGQIEGKDATFRTFSKTQKDEAERGKGTPMLFEIAYRQTQYGFDIDSIKVVEPITEENDNIQD